MTDLMRTNAARPEPRLTDEQKAIVEAPESRTAITAYAGTGKTATLKALAEARPRERILYLAFNRAMADESRILFAACPNVEVRTIHSLAFRHEGHRYRDTLGEFRALDIAPLIFKSKGGDYSSHYGEVKEIHDEFCRWLLSQSLSLDDFFKEKGRPRVAGKVKAGVKKLWKACVDGKFTMPHNGYLKLFQINSRGMGLGYARVMVDEAQDLNDCMIDVIMSRDWNVTLVGDPYQQIYGFNGAVNALGKAGTYGIAKYYLTRSFRCPDDVISKANMYLKLMGAEKEFTGTGTAASRNSADNMVLARTNAGVFDHVAENMRDVSFHFNGGFDGYDFAVLLDMARLKAGLRTSHPFIKRFRSLAALEEYAYAVCDLPTITRLKIAGRYGSGIFSVYEEMKRRQAPYKQGADVTVSTVHKAKGQEASHVRLVGDFLSLNEAIERLDRLVRNASRGPADGGNGFGINDTMEEFRLMYVAITRTLDFLAIPAEYCIDGASMSRFRSLAAQLS
ncbi:MAG: UvrD-helicase domain-containing protein [Deltaproteobacteria bacterium]|jgi:superfamily I DNA/RNA helicase|nr:UvrD-helicase domain-containing protein [Deltaproteobacteria bacterium]